MIYELPFGGYINLSYVVEITTIAHTSSGIQFSIRFSTNKDLVKYARSIPSDHRQEGEQHNGWIIRNENVMYQELFLCIDGTYQQHGTKDNPLQCVHDLQLELDKLIDAWKTCINTQTYTI